MALRFNLYWRILIEKKCRNSRSILSFCHRKNTPRWIDDDDCITTQEIKTEMHHLIFFPCPLIRLNSREHYMLKIKQSR